LSYRQNKILFLDRFAKLHSLMSHVMVTFSERMFVVKFKMMTLYNPLGAEIRLRRRLRKQLGDT